MTSPPQVPTLPAIPTGLYTVDLTPFMDLPLHVVDAVRNTVTAAMVVPAVRDDEASNSVAAPFAALDSGVRGQVQGLVDGLAGVVATVLAFRLFLPDEQVRTLTEISLALQRTAAWIDAATT